MAKLERTYIIPLQKEWCKVPQYKRAKKAVVAVRQFLERHMKTDDVRVGNFLNKHLWARGIKNPPRKVKVNASRDDEGVVKVELFGKEYIDVKAEMEKIKEQAKKDEAKKEEKPAEKKESKKEEPAKTEEKKEAAKEEPKKAEAKKDEAPKKEVKEDSKEAPTEDKKE